MAFATSEAAVSQPMLDWTLSRLDQVVAYAAHPGSDEAGAASWIMYLCSSEASIASGHHAAWIAVSAADFVCITIVYAVQCAVVLFRLLRGRRWVVCAAQQIRSLVQPRRKFATCHSNHLDCKTDADQDQPRWLVDEPSGKERIRDRHKTSHPQSLAAPSVSLGRLACTSSQTRLCTRLLPLQPRHRCPVTPDAGVC